jgi:hypothetical protein
MINKIYTVNKIDTVNKIYKNWLKDNKNLVYNIWDTWLIMVE